jgi:hypothetical protein
MEQILGHLPFSRPWLQSRLGMEDSAQLMAIEADQVSPPLIQRLDLLLVDRRAGQKLPRRDGLYVFSVARGLAIERFMFDLTGGSLFLALAYQTK